MTWRIRSQSQTGEQKHRNRHSGQRLAGKLQNQPLPVSNSSSSSIRLEPCTQTTENQAVGKPCEIQFTLKYILKVYLESYLSLSSSPVFHLISYLKSTYRFCNHRVRIFLLSLFTLLLFWCFALKLMSFPLPYVLPSVPLHTPSQLQQFFGAVINSTAKLTLCVSGHRAGNCSKCPSVSSGVSVTFF